MEKNWIDNAFREALAGCIAAAPYGTQKKLAEYLRVTPGYIYQLIIGRSYGSEHHRRLTAKFFGYSSYDEFLGYGHTRLGGEAPPRPGPATRPEMARLLARVKNLNDSGIKAVVSMLDALDDAHAHSAALAAGPVAQAAQIGAGQHDKIDPAGADSAIELAVSIGVSDAVPMLGEKKGRRLVRTRTIGKNFINSSFDSKTTDSKGPES